MAADSMPSQPIMSDLTSNASSAFKAYPMSPLKRPHDLTHTEDCTGRSRQASPALSDTSSALSSIISVSNDAGLDGANDADNNAAIPPIKRRRLTPTERLTREKEKAERKRVKEEERVKKDAERRAKTEAAGQKKRERELKKQQEDEERAKKERAQSRMTSFFGKPISSPQATPSKSTATPSNDYKHGRDASPVKAISDYQKTFLPFEAPSTAIIAPVNRFTWDDAADKLSKANIERCLADGPTEAPRSLLDTLDLSPLDLSNRGLGLPSTTLLIDKMAGNQRRHVDLTLDQEPRSVLQKIPMKYIYFHQDVRPPYIGTVSKGEPASDSLRSARNPFRRSKAEVDYDYDSEAEWEEPEEGEDLDSEADDEVESQADAEEMDDFLDDEGQADAVRGKLKSLTNDMQPVSTGICWEDAAGCVPSTDVAFSNLEELRMECLLTSTTFPLDPFCISLWADREDKTTAPAARVSNSGTKKPLGRPPLHARPNIAMNGPAPSRTPSEPKAPRVLSGPELELFREVVNGSELNKVGILAVLKKRLPKVPNAVLSATLSTSAARVGLKEADKRWRLLQIEAP